MTASRVGRVVAVCVLGCLVVAASASAAGTLAGARQRVRPAPIRGLSQARADSPDPVSRRLVPSPATSLPSGSWQALGPAPIGPSFLAHGGLDGGVNSGRITALAVIPSGTHSGRVVAGTAGGGIWTSDDSGATWTVRTDSASDLAIGSVFVDPSNSSHLIAGTGEPNQCGDCYPGDGILVSTDGGATWGLQNPGGVFTGADIAQVAIDPTNPNRQFAATTKGLYVTTDGGNTWSATTLTGRVTAVVINPTNPQIVYAAGGSDIVDESTDGGTTWTPANSGISTPGSTPLIALALAPSDPSTLYVSIGSFSPVALYKTTNGAASWSQLSAAPDYTGQRYGYGSGSSEQGWYDNTIAVDPADASHVLAGGIGVTETNDGGTTWTNPNGQGFFGPGTNKFHPDFHALAFAPDASAWIGNDGGVFHYTPSSGAVVNANGNLNVTQFYFGFNVVGGTLLAGSQDNASARTSSSSLSAWTGIWSGDGGPSAITSNDTSLQFIEADQHLYFTTDAFASSLHDITPATLGLFTPPDLVVPNTTTPSAPTVFYGGPDLYRTTDPTDLAPTWTQVTSDGSNVSALAASPSDPSVVYVGFTDGTIQVSTDGGQTFTSLASATTPETFVTGLSVDPSNPNAITASFSFNDTRYQPGLPHVQQYVWTSTPGSGIWTTITGSGLPAAVSRVIYDNGALVAATDEGVYATASTAGSSTTWTRVGAGLPHVQTQDLYADGDGLYVLTHGRGAWLLPSSTVTSTTTALSSSANPSSVGQQVTLTATVSPAPDGGTVAFTDGGAPVSGCGSVAVDTTSGIATCTVTYGAVGSHTLQVAYSGDANFTGSQSATLSQAVNAATTATSLYSSVNPSSPSQQVTFTATVSPAPDGGTVAFTDGGTAIPGCSAVAVTTGQATCQTALGSAGSHAIEAVFSGDANYVGSNSGALTQTVNPVATSTALASSPDPSSVGQQVTLTATVSPAPDGGTVSFTDGASPISGCTNVTVSGGQATCQVAFASSGSRALGASFSGDTNFSSSQSSALSQAVNALSTTTSLSSSANPSALGQTVTVTATVSPAPDGGTVSFTDGASGISGCGAVAVSAGKATCSTALSSSGSHSIGAAYSGDSNYAGSHATALSQVVGAPTITQIKSAAAALLTAVAQAFGHAAGQSSPSVNLSSPGPGSVCVLVFRGAKGPPARSIVCTTSGAAIHAGKRTKHKWLILASGHSAPAAGGKDLMTLRFTRSGKRLLRSGHKVKVTVVAVYALTGQRRVVSSRHSRL